MKHRFNITQVISHEIRPNIIRDIWLILSRIMGLEIRGDINITSNLVGDVVSIEVDLSEIGQLNNKLIRTFSTHQLKELGDIRGMKSFSYEHDSIVFRFDSADPENTATDNV